MMIRSFVISAAHLFVKNGRILARQHSMRRFRVTLRFNEFIP